MPQGKKTALPDNPELNHKQAKAVEAWFQQVTREIESDVLKQQTQKATKLMSTFGGSGSQDITGWLKTPAGKSYIAKVLEAAQLAEANKDNLQFMLRERAKQRNLAMTILALKEEKAEAKEHKQQAQNQAQNAKKRNATKTSSTASTPSTGVPTAQHALPFRALAKEALQESLNEKNTEMQVHKLEWEMLSQLFNLEDKVEKVLEKTSKDTLALLALSEEEQALLPDTMKELLLDMKQDKDVVHDGETYHLVPKGKSLEDLTEEERHESALRHDDLEPQLRSVREDLNKTHQKAMDENTKKLQEHVERTAQLHIDIVNLTNQFVQNQNAMFQLTPRLAPSPENKAKEEAEEKERQELETQNNKLRTQSYELMKDEIKHGRAERNMIHMNDAFKHALHQDIEATNRMGSPNKLAEERTIKPGADPSLSFQDMQSLIRNAERLNQATITESSTSRQFQLQEARQTPDLTPKEGPKKEQEQQEQQEQQRSSLPNPFDTNLKPK